MPRELLAGWGRTAPSAADVSRPASADDVVAALAGAPARGSIARGLGRSYGDAAQNAGGAVISTLCLDDVAWVDEGAGLVRAAGGVGLDELLRFLLPHGWAVPVLPGTGRVTVGGAVAADVHGKNHGRDGSFGRHVVELRLAAADGARSVTPARDPDVFWATIGGLGLTGVVLDATVKAVPARTAAVRVVTRRASGLDEVMAAMEAADGRHRYAVAWLDGLATGSATGRGVLSWGDDAAPAELPGAQRPAPLVLPRGRAVDVPSWLTWGRVPRAAVAAMNCLRYSRAPSTETVSVVPLDRFLFPLDAVGGWNRLYGRAGLVQYQFVVPFPAAHVVRVALERLGRAGCLPMLAVLKRLGDADPAPLSFPMPGWTLAVDFPGATPGLATVLDSLDRLVAAAGGRVYLAKDARLRPELLRDMYPELDRWREVKGRVDPNGALTSDLARRLGLVPSAVRVGAGRQRVGAGCQRVGEGCQRVGEGCQRVGEG